MRRTRWVSGAILGVLLASGAIVGCDKESSSGAPTPTSSNSAAAAPVATPSVAPSASASSSAQAAGEDDPASDELRDYHRHHHLGGATMFIAMSIDTLGVAPEKKAQLEKIQGDLETKMAPARDAEHDLMSTLADGIAAGTIDSAKVDAALAKVATASAAVHAASLDALTQLHDALSPIERAALVDKVKAHWEVWQKVNSEHPSSHEKGTRLAKLTKKLDLTPDQVDKITTALSADPPPTPQNDPKPVDAHIQAFATAFVADKFDPKSLATTANASAGHVARFGGARMARFYEAVTPVLTPDQRTKLAAHLRERMNDPHAGSGK
jgi:Spy/CpxP family protein refolding chaperone